MQAKGSASLCLKTTGENQNNPAGIKKPLQTLPLVEAACSPSAWETRERFYPKTFPRMRGCVGTKGAGDTFPPQTPTVPALSAQWDVWSDRTQ